MTISLHNLLALSNKQSWFIPPELLSPRYFIRITISVSIFKLKVTRGSGPTPTATVVRLALGVGLGTEA